jgi:hypothetical protein|tara:strand:+ start:2242 stop:2484 length:243 start_codon:yes stop_codon:yes gene_type:complete
MKITKINVEFYMGTTIQEAAKEAIELASRLNSNVYFIFNGIELSVPSHTVRVTEIVEYYRKKITTLCNANISYNGRKIIY